MFKGSTRGSKMPSVYDWREVHSWQLRVQRVLRFRDPQGPPTGVPKIGEQADRVTSWHLFPAALSGISGDLKGSRGSWGSLGSRGFQGRLEISGISGILGISVDLGGSQGICLCGSVEIWQEYLANQILRSTTHLHCRTGEIDRCRTAQRK